MNLITNIQKFSIHDGDGIRTTVFFKGCPLKCEWCHNPETQRYEQELQYDSEKCTGCGCCAKVCPSGAITMRMASRYSTRHSVSSVANVRTSVHKVSARSLVKNTPSRV